MLMVYTRHILTEDTLSLIFDVLLVESRIEDFIHRFGGPMFQVGTFSMYVFKVYYTL